MVANEFFDALPVRQWVGDEQRLIVLDGDSLAFTANGLIVEDSPARFAAATAIAAHLVAHGGMALIIDYGHASTVPGDTLQAVRAHAFADPLANPGEQDLTAHVDFQALAAAALQAGASVTPLVTQGDWLTRLGIASRAQSLASANPGRSQELASALARLTAPDQMGDLFKVMAIHHPDWPIPAGFL